MVQRTRGEKVVTGKMDPFVILSSSRSRFPCTLLIVAGGLDKVSRNSKMVLIATGIPPLRFEGAFNVRDNLFEKRYIVVSSGFFSLLKA